MSRKPVKRGSFPESTDSAPPRLSEIGATNENVSKTVDQYPHKGIDTLDESLEIVPVTTPLNGSVRPPGSKSLTNRALICAALANGSSTLSGALDSEDTQVMVSGLQSLGISIAADWAAATLKVDGCAGLVPARKAALNLEGSGTSIRFLTALTATGKGLFTLNGNERMRQRPIGELTDALRKCHTDIESQGGFPPVMVRANRLAGATVAIRGDISSQYLSALLLAAPAATDAMEFHIQGPQVSEPYIEMTRAVMHAFGVEVEQPDATHFRVVPQSYMNQNFTIEPDASAASYFWAAAAITGGRVRVEGLNSRSLQGDVAFCNCLQKMGCAVEEDATGMTVSGKKLSGIDVDMSAISDTVQTLATVALFAEGPTTIRGVGHIRHKESDRIGDLARELRKLGATIQETTDGLCIHPGPLQAARIETYNDHRMAMSLAVAGLHSPGLQIKDPGCTAKTYPGFFRDLENLASAAR